MIVIKGPFAREDLAAFEALAAQWWPTQGFPVDAEGVIGRNAETGELEPEAQRTTKWADAVMAEDGEWYWPSPSADPRFVDWKQYLAATGYVLLSQEIELSQEETVGKI